MYGICCPFCGNEKSRVTDTNKIENGIRRRRECCECRMRWNTFEVSEEIDIKQGKEMVNKEKDREPSWT